MLFTHTNIKNQVLITSFFILSAYTLSMNLENNEEPLDFTNLIYNDAGSRLLYFLLLLTSLISVGLSFVKVKSDLLSPCNLYFYYYR